jgi:hypothetical protein
MSQIGENKPAEPTTWYRKEDSWSIMIALGLVVLISAAFFTGNIGFFKSMAVKIPS